MGLRGSKAGGEESRSVQLILWTWFAMAIDWLGEGP